MVAVKLLHESSEADWDRVMAVNVKSIFFSTKHALPYFRRQRGGYIVNVGSISSFVGQASTPAYTTSKHAVLGLTRSIALDYAADGIRCNCVCPGITDTPMLREHLDATARSRGDVGRPLAARGHGRGADAGRRRPLDLVFQLRGFVRRDRHLADHRLRLSGRRRMGNAGPNRVYGAAMQLKLACADFTFPLLPHDDALDLIAALGFDGVDLGLFEGRSHLQPSREFRNAGKSAGRLRKKLAERGLKAADVYLQTAADFVSLAPNHPDASRRRKARDLFRVHARLRRGLRRQTRLGLAGRAVRRRTAGRFAGPRGRRIGLAVPAGRRPQTGLFGRGARRLDRAPSAAGSAAAGNVPGPDADARLHPLHPRRHCRCRDRAARQACLAFSCPRGAQGPAANVVQRKHDRLSPHRRSDEGRPAIAATSASNTSGPSGNIATRSTTFPRRFSGETSFSPCREIAS